nr:venom polypeptide precursor [Doratifera vulnerans]
MMSRSLLLLLALALLAQNAVAAPSPGTLTRNFAELG